MPYQYRVANNDLGTIVEATSTGVKSFCAGAVLYQVFSHSSEDLCSIENGTFTNPSPQIGYTCVVLLVEVIIADVTSLRSRLFFSYIPATPFIVRSHISLCDWTLH